MINYSSRAGYKISTAQIYFREHYRELCGDEHLSFTPWILISANRRYSLITSCSILVLFTLLLFHFYCLVVLGTQLTVSPLFPGILRNFTVFYDILRIFHRFSNQHRDKTIGKCFVLSGILFLIVNKFMKFFD